nr:putative HVA22-like protein g isoform X2 [Ipomoea trifida]
MGMVDVKGPATIKSVPQDAKTLGEVMFKGNTVMNGYLKATEEAFKGGWFRTGDLGVKHPDGYIEVKDRSKDIIVSGGFLAVWLFLRQLWWADQTITRVKRQFHDTSLPTSTRNGSPRKRWRCSSVSIYAGDTLPGNLIPRFTCTIDYRHLRFLQRLSLFIQFILKLAAEGRNEFNMIGSFLTRGLVLFFGYAYPAYECFKTVELNKPDIPQLRFWCQYWIIVATMAVSERIGDAFISWIPMYSEAKLAFYIYLWFPKTKGTTYVYDSFFRPMVLKHEPEIDRNLLELRTAAGDIALMYWRKAASYGQTRIFDIFQFIVSQSTSSKSSPSAPQPQMQGSRVHQPTTAPPKQRSTSAVTIKQPQNEEQQSSSALNEPSSEHEKDAEGEVAPSQARPTAPPAPSSSAQKPTPTPNDVLTETTKASSSSELVVRPSASPSAKLPAEKVEATLRLTRARLKKIQTAASGH